MVRGAVVEEEDDSLSGGQIEESLLKHGTDERGDDFFADARLDDLQAKNLFARDGTDERDSLVRNHREARNLFASSPPASGSEVCGTDRALIEENELESPTIEEKSRVQANEQLLKVVAETLCRTHFSNQWQEPKLHVVKAGSRLGDAQKEQSAPLSNEPFPHLSDRHQAKLFRGDFRLKKAAERLKPLTSLLQLCREVDHASSASLPQDSSKSSVSCAVFALGPSAASSWRPASN